MLRCSLLVYARQATTRVATTQSIKSEATPVRMETCEAPTTSTLSPTYHDPTKPLQTEPPDSKASIRTHPTIEAPFYLSSRAVDRDPV